MLSAEQVEAQTIVRFSETSHRERKRKIRGDEEVYLLCNETRFTKEDLLWFLSFFETE